ncbi:MAG TPA: ATP-binding protein [Kofleriaceae bacterium]|nr:ATP-binding protein [Kofleriaceae bacterium]
MPTAIVESASRVIHYINTAFGQLLDAPPEAAEGKTLGTLFVERDLVEALLDRPTTSEAAQPGTRVTLAGVAGRPLEGALTALLPHAVSDRDEPGELVVQFVQATADDPAGLASQVATTTREIAAANGRLLLSGLREHAVAEQARRDAAEMKALIANMSEGVAIFEATGELSFMNPLGCRILGVSDTPSLEDLRRCRFRSPDGRPVELERDLLARLLRGEAFADEEVILQPPDGEERHLLVSGSAVRDLRGDVSRVIQVFRDVSAIRQLERFREQYLALITHDLRGPLATAKMSAQIEVERSGDAVGPKHPLSRIIRNLDRMDELLRNLLDAQRVRAGETLNLELANCDLVDITQDVIDELSLGHGDRFRLIGASRAAGSWNALELRRAIWNLASNAIKYGSSSSPVVLEVLERGDVVSLSVTNQGVPIPPAAQERLFDAYNRASVTTGPRAQAGWGLGLTLVRGCALNHGGTSSLTSDATRGTTFTLELPHDARRRPQI